MPEILFQPCLVPDYNVVNYGDYPGYVAQLLAVIERCNTKLLAISRLNQWVANNAINEN